MGDTAVTAVASPADLRVTGPAPSPTSAPSPGHDHGDERFRALFEHAPVGVALCDPDGRFDDVNTAFAALLAGTSIDPSTGCLTDLLRHVPEGCDEAVAWREGLAAVRSGARPVARVELSIAPPGAPVRWVQATAARIGLGERAFLLAHLEDTTPRRLEQQRLLRLALHDGLTGLANRTLLAERLQGALERARHSGLAVGVLFLDLDGFKQVNDTHGHDVGDDLLVAVAARLTAVLRAGDTAGRLGGDEFLVLAGDVADEAGLHEVRRRVEAALGESLAVGSRALRVRASIGAVLSRPGEDGPHLVRRADAAMYAVKRARRRAMARPVAVPAETLQLALIHEQAAAAEAP